MDDPFIGEIILFGGNFAPRNWALCDGQLLPISQYQALFSILGTTYGGDGRTTFALPDMRGRAPVSEGTGPGLSPRPLGSKGGTETVTLNENQMPSHTHGVACATQKGTTAQASPQGNYYGLATDTIYNSKAGATNMAGSMVRNAPGDGGAHENMQPWLCINYIIALVGTFPSRN